MNEQKRIITAATARERQIQAISLLIDIGVAVHWQGSRGIGKTYTIYQLAAAKQRHLEDITISLRLPEDLSGYPLPYTAEDGSKRLAFAPMNQLITLSERRGIGFLDEFTNAAPRQQSAALKLVHENKAGDYKLTDVSWVIASNPPDEAANGSDICGPMANRMVHLQCQADVAQFLRAARTNWAMPELPVLPANWQDGIPATRELVLGFLKRKGDLLNVPPRNESEMSGPSPSPRTWEMSWRIMAACRAANLDPDTELEILAGTVGAGVALEFITWTRDLDLPDPEDLLKDPSKLTLPMREDKLYTCLGSVAAAVLAKPTVPRWTTGLDLCAAAAKAGQADIACDAATSLSPLAETLKATPPASIMAFKDLFVAAGLFGGRR